MNGPEISQKFETFLRKMGYRGNTPSNFRAIYNPSTALLWDQVINSVHPRDEIQHKRNNIIINRLSFNKENVTNPNIELFKDESKYEIKEMEVWNRKQNVTRQYNQKSAKIEELKAAIKSMEEQNNMNHMHLENEQQKLFETKKFVHVLNRKAEEIEKEIQDIETKLSLVRNLTPVEDSRNNGNVLELLKKCSEKLENLMVDENTLMTSQHSETMADDSLGLLGDVTFNDSATLAADFVKSDGVKTEDDTRSDDLLNRLLYKNNRMGIFNGLMELKNLQKIQLNGVMHYDDNRESLETQHNNVETITKLYGAHLDSCLQIIQTENLVKNRRAKLKSVENDLWQKVINLDVTEHQLSNCKEYVLRQRQEFGYEAVIKYLKNLINSVQSLKDEDCNLQNVIAEAKSLNDDIIEKRNSLNEKVEAFISVHKSIPLIQNNTVLLIRKLCQFTSDLNWIVPLIKSLGVAEIHALFKFPLEYNAKIEINEKEVLLRDLPLNYIPYEENEHYFTTFFKVMQDTWCPTEILLTNIFEAQRDIDFYKSLMTASESKVYNKYTLEELRTQESFTFYAIAKLETLLENISMNNTQEILAEIEKSINVWLEMPCKEFVSKSKLFNSLPYEHYEKLYESFYVQL